MKSTELSNETINKYPGFLFSPLCIKFLWGKLLAIFGLKKLFELALSVRLVTMYKDIEPNEGMMKVSVFHYHELGEISYRTEKSAHASKTTIIASSSKISAISSWQFVEFLIEIIIRLFISVKLQL